MSLRRRTGRRLPLDALATAVRDVTRDLVEARPTLVKPDFRRTDNPLAGTCYFATEAYWHLRGGRRSELRPVLVKEEDGWGPHWFLENRDGDYVDPTYEQMGRLERRKFPYQAGRARPFMTAAPSKRARLVMDEVRRRRPDLLDDMAAVE